MLPYYCDILTFPVKRMLKSILITGCSSGIGLKTALSFRGRLESHSKLPQRKRLPDYANQTQNAQCSYWLRRRRDYKGFANTLELTSGLDILFNNGVWSPSAVEDIQQLHSELFLRQIFLDGTHCRDSRYSNAQSKWRTNNSKLISTGIRAKFRVLTTQQICPRGLTDTMRLEINHTNIHLILIEPGPIRTKIRKTHTNNSSIGLIGKVLRMKIGIKKLLYRVCQQSPTKPTIWAYAFCRYQSCDARSDSEQAQAALPCYHSNYVNDDFRRLLSTRTYDALARARIVLLRLFLSHSKFVATH